MTRETMEAWENACEMHFAAFQNFMQLTNGDIGLSLQLTTSYTTAFIKAFVPNKSSDKTRVIYGVTFIKASQMQEKDKKEKEKMQLLLEKGSDGLLN